MTTLTNEQVIAAFAWPDESVCGATWCPQLNGGYCLDCHSFAWSCMMVARQRIANGFNVLLSTVVGARVRVVDGETP